MDKIIDFNELKNKVNEKDIDNFESYIYSLYYKMAEGKLTMAEFTKEMTISYSDYKAEDGKLKSVYLSFDTKEGEDTFYLTYKSGPDED